MYAIRSYYAGNDYSNNTISHNTIDSIGVTLADCGAIYTWHSFGSGNNLNSNTITNRNNFV